MQNTYQETSPHSFSAPCPVRGGGGGKKSNKYTGRVLLRRHQKSVPYVGGIKKSDIQLQFKTKLEFLGGLSSKLARNNVCFD